MLRLKLIWWAICGRPIIHKIVFEGGVKYSATNALIMKNVMK